MPSDEKIAIDALAKRRRGEKITRSEEAAIRRVEKKREEQTRWNYYRTIPQKHWVEMSGRQPKQLASQAVYHGIPFSGATVSLPEVVRALHDFLGENKWAIKRGDKDGESVDWKKEYHREQTLIKRTERLKQQRKLVSAELVTKGLTELAQLLKQCGTEIGKTYGEDALDMFNEHLAAFESKVRQFTDEIATNDD